MELGNLLEIRNLPMDKLSRSKIKLFTDCPRCFWLGERHDIKRPPPAPYTINSAIDYLLKQEFDIHRAAGTPHPIMVENKMDAVPFNHPEINKWRHNFTGVRFEYKPADILVFGAVDDVWVKPNGELIIVDYKATGANQHQIYPDYKQQMEVYQWLMRQNGFNVSSTGYFLFAKVNKAGGFAPLEADAHCEPSRLLTGHAPRALQFDTFLEPCEGNSDWMDGTLMAMRRTLNMAESPAASPKCVYCEYIRNGAEY